MQPHSADRQPDQHSRRAMETRVAAESPPIFAYTKFQPPRATAYFVERGPLRTRLVNAVQQQRVTLVAAPAGSGKTMLVASLAEGRSAGPATTDRFSTAWLTFDEADSDLPVFVTLLVNATRHCLHDEGQAILGFMQVVPTLDEKVSQLANFFINYLIASEDTPLILILDDYHNLTAPAIHQFVTHLVDYMPLALRLVISTRYDPPLPLARWRTRGYLAELRQPDLFFNTLDAATFLNQRHALALSDAMVDVLLQQTEGWIAGLQLVTTVLAAQPDAAARAAYVAQFGTTTRGVFDLLAEEVWGLQTPEVQKFLLQTAVLPELTVASCRAVTQNTEAPRLLELLYRRNLFLRALGSDLHSGPFRYHDLFRDFLRYKLQQDETDAWRDLNLRAADVATNDEQKLIHLQRAEAWEAVADLLQEMGITDTERRITRHIVIQSIEALPPDTLQHRPWLHLFVAQYYSLRGQIEAATPWLQHAAAEFHAQGDEMGEVEILTARAMTSTTDASEIVAGFEAKIATVGAQFRPDHWVVYRGISQIVALSTCDWPALTEIVQTNQREALRSGEPGAIVLATYLNIPHVLFSDAGLASHADFAAEAVKRIDNYDWLGRISGLALSAFIHFFQAQIAQASAASREASRLLQEIGGYAYVDDHVAWLRLVLCQLHGDWRGFDHTYAEVTQRWQTQTSSLEYMRGFIYMRGRALWLRGQMYEAQAALAELRACDQPTLEPGFDQSCQHLLAGLVAIAKGEVTHAEAELRAAITHHQRLRHTILLNHPRLALATCYGQQDRWSDSMRELRAVVEEVRERGMPGVILQEGASMIPVLEQAMRRGVERDYVAPLLTILQEDLALQTIALPDSDDYLTARESEVLRLLATGATNPKIAAALTITERTVKAHVTRILAKLNVTTRTEAVVKVKQLGLL